MRNSSLRLAAPLALLALAAGCHWKSQEERAASPILDKNAQARGGLDRWKDVKALALSGQLEAGVPRDPVKLAATMARQARQGKPEARHAAKAVQPEKQVQLPFTMELARPRKERIELTFQGQRSVQVYDGERGWKVRPFLGRHEVEPFTADELQQASQQSGLDGPLLGAMDGGGRVALEGTDSLAGRPAWRLKVTATDGAVHHVWVDQESGLDVKVDGTRRVNGTQRRYWTAFSDFRTVGGVVIPHRLETTVEGIRGSEKILVERVAVNPKLADARFTRPD